jgi:RNA ligase
MDKLDLVASKVVPEDEIWLESEGKIACKIVNIGNFNQLDKLVEEKYLRRAVSPCGRLVLFNYTDKCTFERKWNKYTLNARGTVYEIATGKIVAKAFPKFFNFSELDLEKQTEILKNPNYTITDKADGSLGIVYYYDGKWRVNTRGSFTSDQAIKATEMLEKYNFRSISKGATLLVEIIYPENRIILDYGDEEKLVLIGAYNTETGDEYDINTINTFSDFPVVETHEMKIPEIIELQKTMPKTQEGFVVRFSNGERVKFKGAEYLRLARAMFSSTPLELWRNMKDGKVDKEFLAGIPEEFDEIIKPVVEKLESSYKIYQLSIADSYMEIPYETLKNRKNLGLFLKENPKFKHKSAMFPFFLENFEAVDKYIMKLIKPVGNVL